MTNKPSEMTDQEIDTALAEKMGWHAENKAGIHPVWGCPAITKRII